MQRLCLLGQSYIVPAPELWHPRSMICQDTRSWRQRFHTSQWFDVSIWFHLCLAGLNQGALSRDSYGLEEKPDGSVLESLECSPLGLSSLVLDCWWLSYARLENRQPFRTSCTQWQRLVDWQAQYGSQVDPYLGNFDLDRNEMCGVADPYQDRR